MQRFRAFMLIIAVGLLPILAAGLGARAADASRSKAKKQPSKPARVDETGISGSRSPAPDSPLMLWYDRPAAIWEEALPVGNGRLGAMVFGRVKEERIQFNEDTLWTGQPHEYQHPGASKFLPIIRGLLAEGKQREAEQLAEKEFMSVPLHQKAYQPFGDIRLRFPGHESVSEYRRQLDLDNAVASTSYRIGEIGYRRQVFSSAPDQVLVVRIEADKPGGLSFVARLDSPHPSARTKAAGDQLILSGQVEEGGLRFEARLRVAVEGGTATVQGEEIAIEGAQRATLLLAAATSFKNYRDISADPAGRCEDTFKRLSQGDSPIFAPQKLGQSPGAKSFDAIFAAHVEDHRRLFRRVALDVGKTAAAEEPTDVRLKSVGRRDDPSLAALYFQFGRYLLISSSRPGCQPANLQGIWNENLQPAWDSKWTTNINTEMNYWPVEVTNLSECHGPLMDMIADLAVTGRKTAEAHYGCHGWVLHHNTDLWRGTAPINASNHGIWVTGGAWLCHHVWEHFLFTGDKEFLATRGYPAMKEASAFFADFLVKDPKTGWLISTPSNSPEQGGLVAGPTMDHQIIRDLLANTIRAAEVLGVDRDFAARLAEIRGQIAPNQIGRYGQLQEWMVDRDDPKNEHRHVSHLWGLYPGSEITPQTPQLFAALRQSLVFRGDGGTGWSKAWKINLWARLLDGDHAHKMLVEALAGNTFPDLLDAHPPFQIDGNFGGTAGIAEMLLQSHAGEVQLLPALPKAWPSGSVRGLCARGGFEIDIAWKEGRLTEAAIRSKLGNRCRLRCGSAAVELETRAGGAYVVNAGLKANP